MRRKVPHLWFYTYTQGGDTDSLLTPASFLELRKDGTYTRDFGFGLKPFEELPVQWKACFFDDEDCRKAGDVIQDIFQHRSIAWAHTDNKYKLLSVPFSN
jgi:hypothetical protein